MKYHCLLLLTLLVVIVIDVDALRIRSILSRCSGVAIAVSVMFITDSSAFAVSGGGKDFATKDIKGQDFSKQDLSGKDFTQVDAQGTNFRGANLKGSRFYRGNLQNADFSNANLESASLEDTSLVNAIFKETNFVGAYFSSSILDASDLSGADFTDSLFPDLKIQKKLCLRDDVKSSTVSRDSLLCD